MSSLSNTLDHFVLRTNAVISESVRFLKNRWGRPPRGCSIGEKRVVEREGVRMLFWRSRKKWVRRRYCCFHNGHATKGADDPRGNEFGLNKLICSQPL